MNIKKIIICRLNLDLQVFIKLWKGKYKIMINKLKTWENKEDNQNHQILENKLYYQQEVMSYIKINQIMDGHQAKTITLIITLILRLIRIKSKHLIIIQEKDFYWIQVKLDNNW
jgi:hypothetical protein